MTRSAFKGTLEIDNGYGAASIQGIRVGLDIRDAEGNPANDRFGITNPILHGLTGVHGSGVLGPNGRGTAQWTLMATRDAAPIAPTVYAVGGTLRYIDPEGREIVAPLYPATITVYPDALLTLDYFQQRDVIGDDPFTAPVEPSEPFTLGLRVSNIGRGEARNLRITSAQPRIIENEKGLLIDFQILGIQVGNQPVSPSLMGSFGNLASGETKVARWLLTSSLMGRFTDYSATFEHVTGLGTTTSMISR